MEIKSIAEVLDLLNDIRKYLYKTTKIDPVVAPKLVTSPAIQFSVIKGIIYKSRMLYQSQGKWFVDVPRHPTYIKCTLIPCVRSDFKPGDVVFMEISDDKHFQDLENYYIILNSKEAACWCDSGEVHTTNCDFNYHYKVEIE